MKPITSFFKRTRHQSEGIVEPKNTGDIFANNEIENTPPSTRKRKCDTYGDY